ncbi:MAG: hypothetical protein Q9178_007892 [Gyalolechia marmorata]
MPRLSSARKNAVDAKLYMVKDSINHVRAMDHIHNAPYPSLRPPEDAYDPSAPRAYTTAPNAESQKGGTRSLGMARSALPAQLRGHTAAVTTALLHLYFHHIFTLPAWGLPLRKVGLAAGADDLTVGVTFGLDDPPSADENVESHEGMYTTEAPCSRIDLSYKDNSYPTLL